MSAATEGTSLTPLDSRMDVSSGQTSSETRERIATDYSEAIKRMMCCSQCRPHSSLFDGTSQVVPKEWEHMPWDEVEMKLHELVDSSCHHVQANQIGLWRGQAASRAASDQTERPQGTEVGERDSGESPSSEWQLIDGPPTGGSIDFDESLDGDVAVKRLNDGGRVMAVRGGNGCQVRIIENENGERILVMTRCCGQAEEGRGADYGVLASMGSPTSTKAIVGLSPQLELMSASNVTSGEDSEPPISPPPTWSSAIGEPRAFKSVVQDSRSAETKSTKTIASSVSKQLPLKDSRGTESKSAGHRGMKMQVTMRVRVGSNLKEIRLRSK